MITIICATHRPKNQTTKVVEQYRLILEHLGQEVKVLEMSELPPDFVFADSFGKRSSYTEALLAQKIEPARKLVIISPEYNGSYPGVFKAFVDGTQPSLWRGKKLALVGVASGRAGNLRGMDHLTDLAHHLRMEVFSLKLPISKLDSLLNAEGNLSDPETLELLRKQAIEFLAF